MTQTTIEISKEYLHFAAAHFTIFSETERENLHGHNFFVQANVDSGVGDDGLAFDYNLVKSAVKAICDKWDELVLLPEQSPHLQISEADGYVIAEFNGERIPFLPRDVITLPIRNVTVEELSRLILELLLSEPSIAEQPISRLEIKVSSGAGQWAGTVWSAT